MDNKVITREKLKTYFEAGHYPTQGQFGELIDSVKHKEDIITNKELVNLANSLVTLDNQYIQYQASDIDDFKLQLKVNSQNEEGQIIELNNTNSESRKLYLLGNGPYTIRPKEFPIEDLGNKYCHLTYNIGYESNIERLIGGGLPEVFERFEYELTEGVIFYLSLRLVSFNKEIGIVSTNIKFINKTEVDVQYSVRSDYWSDDYKKEDSIAEYYDIWGYLRTYHKADLRGTDVDYSLIDSLTLTLEYIK